MGARAGGVGARRAAWVCTASTMKKAKQGLSFESMLLRPAGTGAFLYFSLGRLRGEVRVCATGVLKIIKQACPLRGGLCALRARVLFFLCSFGRLRGGRRGYARRALRKKQSRVCPLRGGLCALRARGLFFILVWAASGEGKAGPVMGLRPLLGPPCIPPEAPRWGFPTFDIHEGCAASASGASSLRSAISLRAAQCQCALSR